MSSCLECTGEGGNADESAQFWCHNATARKRFLREARAAAAVSHDHVITIYAVGDNEPPKGSQHAACGGLPYLIMEFIESEPRNLGAVINTADTELSPALSSDGLKLLFGRYNRSGRLGWWMRERANRNEAFSEPVPFQIVGVPAEDSGGAFSFTSDGEAVVFHNNYDTEFCDLWMATRLEIGNEFGNPRNLGIRLSHPTCLKERRRARIRTDRPPEATFEWNLRDLTNACSLPRKSWREGSRNQIRRPSSVASDGRLPTVLQTLMPQFFVRRERSLAAAGAVHRPGKRIVVEVDDPRRRLPWWICGRFRRSSFRHAHAG